MWRHLSSTWLSSTEHEVQLLESWSSKQWGRYFRPWSALPCIHTLADSISSLSLAASTTSGPTGFTYPSTVQVSSGNGEMQLPTSKFNSSLFFQVAASESNRYVTRAIRSGENNRLGQCSWQAEDAHWTGWHHSVRSFSLQACGSFLHHPVTANPWNPLQLL